MKNAAANAAAFFCIYESRAPRPMPRRFFVSTKPGAAANATAFFWTTHFVVTAGPTASAMD